nr:hypothetical protein Iba_chr10eCG11720 [Ipomoea batatas]
MKIALVSVKKKPLDYENDDTAYADFINFVSSDVELFDYIPHPTEILKEPPSNPLTLTKHELHSILNNFLHIGHLSKNQSHLLNHQILSLWKILKQEIPVKNQIHTAKARAKGKKKVIDTYVQTNPVQKIQVFPNSLVQAMRRTRSHSIPLPQVDQSDEQPLAAMRRKIAKRKSTEPEERQYSIPSKRSKKENNNCL